MSDDAHKMALRQSVLDWQRKFGINDGDPVLASLELLEIYFNHRYEHGSVTQPPSYAEFRETLEHVERLTKRLTKHANEMVQEVRAVPKLTEQLGRGRTAAPILTVLSALSAGILIGKFLL